MPPGIGSNIGVEGDGAAGAVCAEVQHPGDNTDHRAEAGVAAASVAKGFAADAIFLVAGERERDERGGGQIREG